MNSRTYSCSVCGGSGQVSCSNCGGTTKLACTGCGRTGKVWLSYSNQWSSCGGCWGSGYTSCFSCRSGKVNCSSCGGRGHHINYSYVEASAPACKPQAAAAGPRTSAAPVSYSRSSSTDLSDILELGVIVFVALFEFTSRVIILGGLFVFALIATDAKPEKFKGFSSAPEGRQGGQGQAQSLKAASEAPPAAEKRPVSVAAAANGTWSGRYLCNQGWTGLTLEISGEASKITAVAEFFALPSNPSVSSGRWMLQGQFDEGSRRLGLRPVKALQMPVGYFMIGFDAQLDGSARRLVGNVIGGTNCGEVSLIRLQR